MASLIEAEIGYGSIKFIKAIEPTPTTSETEGNVTVKNMGSPGVPAYYDASFMLHAKHDKSGVTFSNIFHWNVIVNAKTIDAPYSEIEGAAALQIAPMLRELADEIEKQVAGSATKTE
ncbi:hypothetical protein [Sphingomonas bacterium]|uniref:hypothetical protein n=1 Tax=Sphingomonas bacterium TaxID=1895847 RepID=UPI002614F6FC|nr:hypothetical protein [Sphingomonas bacterium]MDB5678649.1 hypothetical protein [Sphingomonas bacterium]